MDVSESDSPSYTMGPGGAGLPSFPRRGAMRGLGAVSGVERAEVSEIRARSGVLKRERGVGSREGGVGHGDPLSDGELPGMGVTRSGIPVGLGFV